MAPDLEQFLSIPVVDFPRSLLFAKPLLQAQNDLLQFLKECGCLNPSVEVIIGSWAKQLDTFVAPVIAYCMSLFKEQLSGVTPKERYQSFFTREKIQNLLQRYPLLSHYINLFLTNRLKALIKGVQKLALHIEEVSEKIRPLHIKDLSSVSELASDPHEGGEMVLLFTFSNDSKLLFKPRGATCLKILSIFVQKLKLDVSFPPSFIPEKCSATSDYYFSGFIQSVPCTTKQQVGRFYRKCGSLLSLCQLFGFHDGHRENVIASGETPYLVDPETLCERFQNSLVVTTSILETGLLQFPPIAFSGDLSYWAAAFQQPEDEELAEDVPHVVGDHTENIRIVFRPIESINPPSAVLFESNQILSRPTIVNYNHEFIQGYTECLNIIRDNSKQAKQILEQDWNLRCRIILRHTSFYQQLHWQLFQPDMLISVENSRKFLSQQLHSYSKQSPLPLSSSQWDELISIEVSTLLHLDIPSFYSNPQTCDLISESNCILKVFKQPFDMVQRLRKITIPAIVHESTEYIKKLISTEKVNITKPQSHLGFALHHIDTVISAALALDSFYCQTPSQFHEANPRNELSLTYRLNLFDGFGGAVVGSSIAFRISQDPAYQIAGIELADMMWKELEGSQHICQNLGALYGVGSVLISLSCAAREFKKPEYVNKSYVYLAKMLHTADFSLNLDYVHGSGGLLFAIQVLLDVDALFSVLTIPQINHLQNIVITLVDTILQEEPQMDFVTGFSHGYAGIIVCLSSVRENTFLLSRRNEIDNFIERLCNIEDSFYNEAIANWKYVPVGQESNWDQYSWCHGAPGVLLSRFAIGALDLYPSAVLRLYEETKNMTPGGSDTLCCGTAGIIQILHDLGMFEEENLALEQLLIRSHEGKLRVSGTHYGLYQGILGVALVAINSIAPDTPSVLLWQKDGK